MIAGNIAASLFVIINRLVSPTAASSPDRKYGTDTNERSEADREDDPTLVPIPRMP